MIWLIINFPNMKPSSIVGWKSLGATRTVCSLGFWGAVDLMRELYPSMIEDELLDTSNYPKDHELYSNKLNSRLGCIKDEFKGVVCKEVVLLAPKCYSFELIGGKVKATAKGVGRSVRERLTHQDYRDRFQQKTELNRTVNRLQSYDHKIFQISQDKIALSWFENKRAWINDNASLPYGHYKLS